MSPLSNLKAYVLENLPPPTVSPLADSGSPSATGVSAPPAHESKRSDSRSTTMTLPDGRKLGYAQYGTPDGPAIISMHGLPGSRLEGEFWHDAAVEAKARFVTLDRPGMGLSMPDPKRTLLDHAKDVEQLAEYLGLHEFRVLGTSGGGPYALACARSIPPEKLRGVAVVCGIGPPDIGMKGAQLSHYLGFTCGWRYFPWLSEWYVRRGPRGRLDLSDEERLRMLREHAAAFNPKDGDEVGKRDSLFVKDEDLQEYVVRSSRATFSQGYGGVGLDGKLVCSDWGFRIEDVPSEIPVQLWYGEKDSFVPSNHGRTIAARLGSRAQLRLEDDTHASISTRWRKEIIQELISVK